MYLKYYSLFFFVFLMACGGKGSMKAGQKALARVHDSYLYAEEIEGLGQGMTPEDSSLQVQIYIQQWVQDQLLLHEAEGKIKNTDKIERSVQDLRTSLILNEYEQILVTEKLDSVVTPQQIADYYEQNKDQFQSGVEWVRCYFVKSPMSAGNIDELKAWFNSGTRADLDNIRVFCKKNNTPTIMDENFWVQLDRILVELPSGELPERYLSPGTFYVQNDDDYLYLYRTLEYRSAEDALPMSKAKEEIIKIILMQRRMQLLESNRTEILEKGKQAASFEMF